MMRYDAMKRGDSRSRSEKVHFEKLGRGLLEDVYGSEDCLSSQYKFISESNDKALRLRWRALCRIWERGVPYPQVGLEAKRLCVYQTWPTSCGGTRHLRA
jgi:hypothetical protein